MHYFPLDAFQHALSPPCALHSALQSTLNPTGALRVQRFDVFNNVSYRGFLLLLLFLFYFLNSRSWRLTCWKHKNHSAFFLKREQGSVHFCSQSRPSAAFKSCGIKEIYDLRAFKTFVELQNDGREEFMLVCFFSLVCYRVVLVDVNAFHKSETEEQYLPHDLNAALHLSATHIDHDA